MWDKWALQIQGLLGASLPLRFSSSYSLWRNSQIQNAMRTGIFILRGSNTIISRVRFAVPILTLVLRPLLFSFTDVVYFIQSRSPLREDGRRRTRRTRTPLTLFCCFRMFCSSKWYWFCLNGVVSKRHCNWVNRMPVMLRSESSPRGRLNITSILFNDDTMEGGGMCPVADRKTLSPDFTTFSFMIAIKLMTRQHAMVRECETHGCDEHGVTWRGEQNTDVLRPSSTI
jgi:hypothetical protein